ncbi:LysR family transcriptional regulator [Rhabdaerophilum sp. SD176]|uniref:LysR family transcriptional regulator n=1 Tax=Rhabdaerophilum sp. SD176 TaxID=2983548 RepID=UPI0024DF686D|nr:LysR family transcriptional regulator [Rhabdaerophilum sp. SD176]
MNDMAAFVRIVEEGSFAAAAPGLGLTPSALSKLVSRLEDRLRVRLLTRTTRRLALTAEGQTYLERAREILAAIEAVESDLSQAGRRPGGRVRVDAGTAIAKHQLAPLLPVFHARYPEISVDLSVTDRQIDPVAEHVDLVLRTGAMGDSSLQAVRLYDGHRRICASPDYLARNGVPRTPADLASHQCLLLSHQPHLARWPFHTPEGVNAMTIRAAITVDSADILLDLAIGGAGIVRLGNILVDRALADGRLVSLLEDVHAVEPFPVWAVMPPGRFRVHRVRVLLDFLKERLGAAPS